MTRLPLVCGCDIHEPGDDPRLIIALCPNHRYDPTLARRVRQLLQAMMAD